MKFSVKLDVNKIFSSYAIFREEIESQPVEFNFEKDVRPVEEKPIEILQSTETISVEFERLSTSGC